MKNMTLKTKLLLTISIVAILGSLLSLLAISRIALTEMEAETLVRAQEELKAKRALISKELSNYIGTIEKQAKVMANDVSIKKATVEFTDSFFNSNTSGVSNG
jgi:hypothetical protein